MLLGLERPVDLGRQEGMREKKKKQVRYEYRRRNLSPAIQNVINNARATNVTGDVKSLYQMCLIYSIRLKLPRMVVFTAAFYCDGLATDGAW